MANDKPTEVNPAWGQGIINTPDHKQELHKFPIADEPAPTMVTWKGKIYTQWGDDYPNKKFFYSEVVSVG